MAKEVQTVKVVVTNISRNPRGVNRAAGGTVMVERGQTSSVIEISAGELSSLRAGNEFTVKELGEGKPVLRRAAEPARVTAGDAALRRQIEDKDQTIDQLKLGIADLNTRLADQATAFETLKTEADASSAAVDDLTAKLEAAEGKLGERDTTIEGLNAQIAAFEAEPVDDPATGLNREELKQQAKELGIEFARNVTTEKLKELVDAKLAA